MDAKSYDLILKEHFDCSDRETMKTMLHINEADQNTMILSLTTKLYDHIVNKIDDIDFGSIPSSQGDITKVENFDQMVDCLDVIKNYLLEFKQDTSYSVDVINKAIQNIADRVDLFKKGFMNNSSEFIMITYSSLVLAVISSTSFLISSAIEFIKEPGSDNFNVTVDKVGLQKTKNNLLFNNLKKFNASCDKGEFDKSIQYILSNIKAGVKDVHESISVATGFVAGAAIAGITLTIIPTIRELIFFFYHSRTKISDYFETQADLLQINAYNIQNRADINGKQKKDISAKQMKIVSTFRKIANFFTIDAKKAELQATKDIIDTKKKYKVNDLTDEKPDSAPVDTGSSLF